MFQTKYARWVMVAALGLMLCARAASTESDRKVLGRVKPIYPELARQMNVSGTVKIEVAVASDGTVKIARPLGGHPLLIKSATEAVRKWRYAPGPETTIIVEFQFHPGD